MSKEKMTYEEWKKEVLEIMEKEYYLGENEFDEITLERGYGNGDVEIDFTPREWCTWYAEKYDLINCLDVRYY